MSMEASGTQCWIQVLVRSNGVNLTVREVTGVLKLQSMWYSKKSIEARRVWCRSDWSKTSRVVKPI